MKTIQVQGNQFKIGDEIRPYKMATSFCLLGHYQAGDRGKGRAWLDRLKALGFDGPRVFGEDQDWFNSDGKGFFGNPKYTTRVAVMDDRKYGDSSLEPSGNYRKMVEEFVEDLNDRNMIAEFCCVATVKGRDESVTSNLLNGYARMLRTSFGDETPLLHETVNEVTAHSEISLEEAGRFGLRWHRYSTEPSKWNYPGSTIGQSDGGAIRPTFATAGYTHINVHPPRGPRWYETDFEELVKLNGGGTKPVALNETICVLSQVQWDQWVTGGVFGANQCTTDWSRAIQYLADAYWRGLSITAHYLEGMSTDPDLPVSLFEQEFAEELGNNVMPEQKKEYRHIVQKAFQDILLRDADQGGLEAWNNAMKNGLSEVGVRLALINSDEFKNRFLISE